MPTTTTMQLIAKQTVGVGGASTISFSSIPQTFTDLRIYISGRSTNAYNYDYINLRFNSDTNTYYDRVLYTVSGNGESANGSGNQSQYQWLPAASATANTYGATEIIVPNYSVSGVVKTFQSNFTSDWNTTTGNILGLNGAAWSGTAPITSIQLTTNSGTWVEFSTVYLYGVSKSATQNTTVPSATGGDIITTDGTYWYHAYMYSGLFTPLKSLTSDVLVVAGGGGGGGYTAGGGGAGGVSYQSGRLLSANSSYACVIGAGGVGGATAIGTNGGNSVFDTIVSNGGGGGSYNDAPAGISGGSGGGVSWGGGTNTGGAATQGNTGGATGYGFRGGNVAGASPYGSSGGGGAGGAGQDITSSNWGGNGGAAKNTWSTWLSATGLGVSGYIAGGGGGGGDDGGGNGGGGGAGSGGLINTNGGTATPNTGSGGGGTRAYYGLSYKTGGNGGSGLVIVRYAV